MMQKNMNENYIYVDDNYVKTNQYKRRLTHHEISNNEFLI